MPKLPYFPLNPYEYLLDEKIESLKLEEEGAINRLWCYMWINKIKRGHLLYDKKTPISDEQLAKRLRISSEKFKKIKEKFLEIKILKIGKFKELYSMRLSKYKTPYELYDKKKRPFRDRSGKVQGSFGNRSGRVRPHTLPNHTLPNHTLPKKPKTLKPDSASQTSKNSPAKLARLFDARTVDPIQKDKETIVKEFQAKFPSVKKNIYGIVHKILIGKEEYGAVGPSSYQQLSKLIELMPEDLSDPVARFCDMALSPATYLP